MTPDTPETMDYSTLTTSLRTTASALGLHPTSRRIGGVNFITADVLGTYRLPDGRLVELAVGTGMHGQWLIGITVRPEQESWSESACVLSVEEARAHLAALIEGSAR